MRRGSDLPGILWITHFLDFTDLFYKFLIRRTFDRFKFKQNDIYQRKKKGWDGKLWKFVIVHIDRHKLNDFHVYMVGNSKSFDMLSVEMFFTPLF